MTSPLTGLSAAQAANAAAIVAEVKREGLPLQAAQIAITTAIVESGLLSQANSNVPDSLSLPHDKVGNDGTSVGLFQQQNSWGTVSQRLNAQSATALFLARLPAGWQSQDPGAVAQRIQVSAYPDRYDQNYANGAAVAAALWGNTSGTQNVLDTGVPSNTVALAPPSGAWQSINGKPIADPPVKNSVGKNPDNWNIDANQAGTYYQYALPVDNGIPATTLRQCQDWANAFNENKALAYTGANLASQAAQTAVSVQYNNGIEKNCERTKQTKQIPVDPGEAEGGIGPIPNPLSFLSDIFGWLTNKNNWIRIGLYVLGGIICLIVAILWFRGTDTGQSLPTVIPI